MKNMDMEAQIQAMGLTRDDLVAVLGRMNEGVLIVDKRGRVVFCNEAAARIDGMDVQDMAGNRIENLYKITPETSPVLRCLHQKRPIEMYTQFYRTRSGQAVFAVQNAYPLYDDRHRIKGAVCFYNNFSGMERGLPHASDAPPRVEVSPDRTIVFEDIIGQTPELLQAVHTARMASDSPSAIMLYGRSGTGKELFAQAIHNTSPWRENPFVGINCSAIPETLLEGILFGTARGAFTDARDKAGLFEQANGGTLFLDEINSMPVGVQAKLLRVLQEKKVRRVGSMTETPVNLKVISSVNSDPAQSIARGMLRSDLYYRLAVVFVYIPPLKERMEDMKELVKHFLAKCNRSMGRQVSAVSPDVMACFQSYGWPGNVRELEHVIEGAMNMVSTGRLLEIEHLPVHFMRETSHQTIQGDLMTPLARGQRSEEGGRAHGAFQSFEPPSRSLADQVAELEADVIRRTLADCRGNGAMAARVLGLSRQLIYQKMKRYHIGKSEFKVAQPH